jgi:hypothetical protein
VYHKKVGMVKVRGRERDHLTAWIHKELQGGPNVRKVSVIARQVSINMHGAQPHNPLGLANIGAAPMSLGPSYDVPMNLDLLQYSDLDSMPAIDFGASMFDAFDISFFDTRSHQLIGDV